jgi:hypothetical protein
MGALKKQKFIADSDKLTSRYGGVPVIFVESEEDRHIFGDCWFRDRLSKVEFKPALSMASSSGCNGVISAVSDELKAGNAAWGIVDRDAVMSRDSWDIVNETDDATYDAKKPFGNNIKTLCRWEIESYLVDGESLEYFRAGIEKQTERNLDVVYQELFDHCQALIPHAAINALSHQYRQKGLGDGYTNRFSSRAQVDSDIQSNQLPKLTASASEYAQQISQIEAFDYPESTSAVRVNGLLRRVHGKAVLARFLSAHKIQVDLDGMLAKRIEEKKRVPTEIANFVADIAAMN